MSSSPACGQRPWSRWAPTKNPSSRSTPPLSMRRQAGWATRGHGRTIRCQDMLGMAYAGLLFTASPEQDEPFAPPGATNDVLTGTMTALGVLAALLESAAIGTRGNRPYLPAAHRAVDAADPVRHRRERAPVVACRPGRGVIRAVQESISTSARTGGGSPSRLSPPTRGPGSRRRLTLASSTRRGRRALLCRGTRARAAYARR